MLQTLTGHVKAPDIASAVVKGNDAFIDVIVKALSEIGNGQLDETAFLHLNTDQLTLWGYAILRNELMEGGFIQLICNGYGPFFFDNPYARVIRMWGLKDFSKLLYKARTLYIKYKEMLTRPYSDEEFMALYERFPEFDALDDSFVEHEEEISEAVAKYVHDFMYLFVTVESNMDNNE